MAAPKINLQTTKLPEYDGHVIEYVNEKAEKSGQFDPLRKVIFINGMLNQPEDHAESALALSMVQMSAVIGIYNKSVNGWSDFWQCVSDKNQFDGPGSLSANTTVKAVAFLSGGKPEDVARAALARNPCQVAVFDELRLPKNRYREIFAHSQGNLILSNALQAIAAVDGPGGLTGRVVHTFGSPSAAAWPKEVDRVEHAFTWDMIAVAAGFDFSFRISKVGLPRGARSPFRHSFLAYIENDPAFVVNRFRTGGLGMTFNMDEDGLAKEIAMMGTNMERVRPIFAHLDEHHPSDADDVAVRYVKLIRHAPATGLALKADRPLVKMLIRILDEGWTSAEEKEAIAFLQAP